MIAKLTGVVDQISPESLVVDVGGVGYLTFCSTRTIGRLPAAGAPASLLIETHVRENGKAQLFRRHCGEDRQC